MSEKKKPFQVYLYPSEREKLGELAEKKEKSVNEYMRDLISKHIARVK